ncbi:amidohydrolase family protein [Pseudoroseicyclus sp. H15]
MTDETQPKEPPLVDSHFHIYTTDLPLAEDAWHRPPEDAGTDRLIRTLDEHGVMFGVVAAASLHGTYNDHVRDALRQHRRLRATAVVDPDISQAELQGMDADGFVGIRFVWSVKENPPDITSAPYRRLLRRVADLGWHVHFIERPARMAGMIAAIEEAGATAVVDHMGLPKAENGMDDPAFKTLLEAVDRGRTWVKLSAAYRFKPPASGIDYARALIERTGGERLVWASDWPFAAHETTMTYARALQDFHDQVLDPELRRRIGGRNPLALYFA